MDYTALPIRSVMFSMSAVGALIGLMIGLGRDPVNKNEIWLYMASGALLLMWVGWRIIKWMANRADRHILAVETVTPINPNVERVTLVVKVPGLSDKLIHGISREDLQLIGECVAHNGIYLFSVQHFKDYFKNSGTDGYSLYNKSVRWMQDCGALMPNAKGGFDVTEHIGRNVFNAMRDSAWQELREYDTPPLSTRV